MKSILNLSEAAAIALHAADLLTRGPDLRSAQEIAAELGISYNHLSKVLQQLTRAGLVSPARGPKGGFALSQAGRKATVREFITAIDGPPGLSTCLMKAPVCRRRSCMFGKFLEETNSRFEAVLRLKISEFSKRA